MFVFIDNVEVDDVGSGVKFPDARFGNPATLRFTVDAKLPNDNTVMEKAVVSPTDMVCESGLIAIRNPETVKATLVVRATPAFVPVIVRL